MHFKIIKSVINGLSNNQKTEYYIQKAKSGMTSDDQSEILIKNSSLLTERNYTAWDSRME